jgi:polyhydroxybutyrate depolymerase
LIDRVEHDFRVDNARIFATGISNGALFAHRLGCDLSSRIAGIAPVAGTLPADIAQTCRPTQPVAVLQIDGTADPIMPYGGGPVKDFGGKGEGGQVTSVENSVRFWSKHNRCSGPGVRETLPVIASLDPTRVVRVRHASCPAAGQVTLMSIIGGGHVWPGGAQAPHPLITGRPSRQLDASETIASFFLSLPSR